ncbi:MAG: LysM peptidoglycan-binding domain-containing protein [Chloroflexi bacterium]|nr:LysM peptidoglycan-binding domain-containing protein [Chloroflexota bacterium]
MSNASSTNRTCPSLGLLDDAETSLAFPSIWNCCYRSRPIAPPKLKYQEEFCLCENHRECPLFLSGQAAPLPGHIRAPRGRKKRVKKFLWRTLFVFLIVIGVVSALAWNIWDQGVFSSFTFEKANETAPAAYSPTTPYTPSPEVTASASPAPTLTSMAALRTRTPAAPLSKHQLELPIGTDHKFLIHSVLEGENLDQYAPKYNTSVEAIMAVNHTLQPPVWVGTLVVIPIGFTDVSDLPSFEIYMITESGMTVELLAQKFSIDPLDLKYFNAINDGERLLVGDWFLIPRTRIVP